MPWNNLHGCAFFHTEPLEVQELHRRSLLAHDPSKSAWAPKTNRASATTFVQVHP